MYIEYFIIYNLIELIKMIEEDPLKFLLDLLCKVGKIDTQTDFSDLKFTLVEESREFNLQAQFAYP